MADLMVQNLTKKIHKKLVVNHINMTISAGQFVAFLGPNGSGKSTTVKMLTGLMPPTEGSVYLNNKQLDKSSYQKKIGVVFQNSVLDSRLTVAQNLKTRRTMYRDTSTDWFDKLCQSFELKSIWKQKYGLLSGGQRRRVDIARALLHKPEILILDEPSTGLDIQTRTAIWKVIDQLRRENKLTVILTTHYLEETEDSDFVFVIDHGRIIAADSVKILKQKYAQYELTLASNDQVQLIKDLNSDGLHTFTEHQRLKVKLADAQQVIVFVAKYRSRISDFECKKGDMNSIFLTLTGKEIR